MADISYILYIDESGDPGKATAFSSKHFILSGIIVPINDWLACLDRTKDFRLQIKANYGLLMKTEIHASELIRINKIKEYSKIKKNNRLSILKEFAEAIPKIFPNSRIINVCLNKSDFTIIDEFQSIVWNRMIQRYETFLAKNNNAYGIIISDDTNEPLVRRKLREMRRYNPLPGNRNEPTIHIVEDVIMKTSFDSYFIQAVDTIAHLLYRREYPKSSLKKYNVDKYFSYFEPILLREASKTDSCGIVRH